MSSYVWIEDRVELTNYIRRRFHAPHREQLRRLIVLSERVEDLHFFDDGAPVGLSGHLRRLTTMLRIHMIEEERIIFPAIRGGAGRDISKRFAALREDHDGYAADICMIRAATNGLRYPNNANPLWQKLYRDLGVFIADFQEHMRIEEERLFPQIDEA